MGGRGIPRQELLIYVLDVAHELDRFPHSGQICIIRPEEVLFVGKSVQIAEESVVETDRSGDVTMFVPLYSPPEVFEGRLHPTAQQYALAIVYQLMLTGTPPFNGRTAAQLTAQHIRLAPDVSSLPPMDRPIVSRALNKAPVDRYRNCVEFARALPQ